MENELLVLVHTVSPLIDVFRKLAAQILPGVKLMHILDEPVLQLERQGRQVRAEVSERLRMHVAMAERVGADAVLVTCSSISPNVEDIRSDARIPVVKIDEAMIARAVETGTHVGVVATAESTLEPTRNMLADQAANTGKHVRIQTLLVDGALPALLSGDAVTHDRTVRQAALEMADRVDVVVLAQASMARVLEVIPEAERPVPILSSPHLALEQVKGILARRGQHCRPSRRCSLQPKAFREHGGNG